MSRWVAKIVFGFGVGDFLYEDGLFEFRIRWVLGVGCSRGVESQEAFIRRRPEVLPSLL